MWSMALSLNRQIWISSAEQWKEAHALYKSTAGKANEMKLGPSMEPWGTPQTNEGVVEEGWREWTEKIFSDRATASTPSQDVKVGCSYLLSWRQQSGPRTVRLMLNWCYPRLHRRDICSQRQQDWRKWYLWLLFNTKADLQLQHLSGRPAACSLTRPVWFLCECLLRGTKGSSEWTCSRSSPRHWEDFEGHHMAFLACLCPHLGPPHHPEPSLEPSTSSRQNTWWQIYTQDTKSLYNSK